MDYLVWGEEYLREAEHLRERVGLLRRQAADATEEKEADKLEGRIQLLYGMYLDCLHVGNYLIKCGRLR